MAASALRLELLRWVNLHFLLNEYTDLSTFSLLLKWTVCFALENKYRLISSTEKDKFVGSMFKSRTRNHNHIGILKKEPFHVFFFFNFWHEPGENPSIPLERATEERLKINKIAKFESDLLKTSNEGIAPQSHEILQTFVRRCKGGGGRGGGGGAQTCPHHKTSVDFRKFAELYRRSLKTYYFQICHSLPISKALVLAKSTDFPWLIHQWEALKKPCKGLL